MSLDSTDVQLINLLSRDASQSNVALARQLDVSDVTVGKRVQKLSDEGIIRIVAVIDPNSVGYPIQIISGIEVEPGRAVEVGEALANLDQTAYVGVTLGEFDLIVVSHLRSNEEQFHFLTNVVPSISGVRRIQTSQVLKVGKLTFRYDRILNFLKDSASSEDFALTP